MEGGLDAAAFADWLSVDERLRRAIEKKKKPSPAGGGGAAGAPAPSAPAPPPARPE
jgi:hypothetical protein